jgi:hypothetical protein
MDMYVRLTMDDDGPVVVKSAAPAAQDRLRTEIDRLSRAVHPGVVTVVGSSVDGARGVELRTRFAGEPVSAWTGTVPSIAGLGAGVAATIADLHGVGVVHGRIDESHVLVGDDGRPRLCGFSGPSGAAPPDDVAGLAKVMLRLMDRATPPPGRRWRTRRSRSDERVLRQVLDRAVDPLPTRRPTAIALADAILLAVPSADLPTPPTAAPDTFDRIWSAAEQGTDAERWARALGEGPPDLTLAPVPLARLSSPAWPEAGPTRLDARTASEARRKLDDATGHHRAEPRASSSREAHALADAGGPVTRWIPDHTMTAERPHRAAGSGSGRRPRPPAVDEGEFAGRRPPVDRTDGESAAHRSPRTEQPHLAGRSQFDRRPQRTPPVGIVAGSVAGVPDEAGPAALRTGPAGSSGLIGPAQHDPAARPAEPSGLAGGAGEETGLTIERPHLAGRGGLGGRAQPAEPADEPPPEPRRSRRMVVGVAAVAVVVVGAGVLAFRANGDGEPASSGPPPPPPGCPAVARPAADVDADGCPEALAVEGATVTAGTAQWTLGEPGDIAAVGDWDCDGQASAALLRPRTGDVFAFPAWAETGAPVSVRPIERVGGATGIRARTGEDGCDELVVDLASGAARSVEVPA